MSKIRPLSSSRGDAHRSCVVKAEVGPYKRMMGELRRGPDPVQGEKEEETLGLSLNCVGDSQVKRVAREGGHPGKRT